MIRLVFLVAIGAIAQLSIGLSLPVFSLIARDLSVPAAVVQASLSAFLASYAIGQLFFGVASDRFGRKPLLVAGLGLYCLAGAACARAESASEFFFFRLFEGFGSAAGAVLARTVARDWLSGQALKRALSLLSAGNSIVPASAPLLGAVLAHYVEWRGSFLVTAAIGALLLISVAVAYAESRPADAPDRAKTPLASTWRTLLTDRQFVLWMLCGSLAFGVWYSFLAGASVAFFTLLGKPPEEFGLMQPFTVGAYVCGALAAGYVSETAPFRLALAGTSTIVVSCLALTGVFLLGAQPSAITIALVTACATFGIGVVVPTANFCALSRHGANAGAASAFLGFCNMGIGGAASSLLTGLVQQHFGNQMFGVVMLVLALLSMATVIAVDRDDSAAS